MNAVEVEPAALQSARVVSRGYWRASGRRFLRQPIAVSALVLLIALFVVGALAQRIARQVHGVVGSGAPHRNSILIRSVYASSHVVIRKAGKGYVLELGIGIATKLAADEHALRYRF